MVEFNCSQCQTLLRIPDDASGKSIRCPQCNHIQMANIPPEPSRDIIAPSNEETRPYLPPPIQDTGNPYQSPRYDSTEKSEYIQPGGDLVHSKVGFTEVFTGFWNTFSKKIGPCAIIGVVSGLVTLFFVGMALAIMYGGMAVIVLSGAHGDPNAPPQVDPVIIVVLVVLYFLSIVAANLAGIYFSLGAIRAMLDIARGGEGKLGLLFVDFSLFIRGIVLCILVALIYLGAMLVTAGPFGLVAVIAIASSSGLGQPSDAAVVVTILSMILAVCFAICVTVFLGVRLVLSMTFLVDRNCTATEAIKPSFSFTKGNFLSMFLVVFCFGLAFNLISQMTGGILAIIFGVSAYALLYVIMYLLATGQKMAFPPDGSGTAVANDENYYGPVRA